MERIGRHILFKAGVRLLHEKKIANALPTILQPRNTCTVPIVWNNAALQAIRQTQPDVISVAHILATLHTGMFDAWAAYDSYAAGTIYKNILRRPLHEHTLENKEEAISYAAYRILIAFFPQQIEQFTDTLREMGYDTRYQERNALTPQGIGNLSAGAILKYRSSFNTEQMEPFALSSKAQFRPTAIPASYAEENSIMQVNQILELSAQLTDRQKVIAEYWSKGPHGEQPPGQWCLIAQYVAHRDAYTLDTMVKLFFILTNALYDAGIACKDARQANPGKRPVDIIHNLLRDKQIQAWGGPYRGTCLIEGKDWRPFITEDKRLTLDTAEFCAEVSVFSAIASAILSDFSGSDYFGGSYTMKAGASQIEPGVTPANPETLSWKTFSEAAQQAGISQGYAGLHFEYSDKIGKQLGILVATQIWSKTQQYIQGNID